ncbi:MAG: hypothetical protein IQL11_02470 [Bacteroidales bacterium]|nr:hypothetical protein [Bacteroidales bacterium]
MEKTVKILVLNNEIEARLLSGLLTERNILHILKSYHDTAYDGLWQSMAGWGQLDALEKDREEILQIYHDIVQQQNETDE